MQRSIRILMLLMVSWSCLSLYGQTVNSGERDNKPEKIDDRYLHLFSEERMLDSSTGYFTGLPAAVVHKGMIYVVYTYHSQHQSVPGVEQDYCYYRLSKDGGKTWSRRLRLKFPSSQIPGLSYDYRGLQMVNAGDRILCMGILVPSDSNGIKAYSSFYCELEARKNGKLKYSRFTLMPQITQDGRHIKDPVQPGDKDKTSNIVAGNILLHDGYLYWCNYNSARNVQLLRWNAAAGDYPVAKTMEILANIGDNSKEHRYSEVGMFCTNGVIYMSIRDEYAQNSNWKYDIKERSLQHLGNTMTKAFGPNIHKPQTGPALLTGRQYTYLKSSNQLTRMDNLILLSSKGEIIKENIGFVGHPMGGDSMYCSTVESDGTIYIFYYYGMNSSQVSPNSHYVLAYKTIKTEDLQKLMKQ